MPRKPTKANGPGQPGPAEARTAAARWIETGHLAPYPEQVRSAALNLVRIAKWPDGMDVVDFQQAVFAYDQMLQRDSAWDRMPQRERNSWIEQFETTIEKLLSLIAVAPRPPEQHGFPIRDNLLLHTVAHAMKVAVPQEEGDARWRMMLELEKAFDSTGINFAHAVMVYQQAQRADYRVRQTLAKPREEGANRVFFATSLWQYTDLSPSSIAAVATTMLDVDVTTPDVNRWVKTYARQRVRVSRKAEKP